MSALELTRGMLPDRDPRCFWIECLEAGASIRFTCYSPAIWGLWTHYTGKTKPCFKNHDFCEGGHDEGNLRWYGYIFGMNHVRNQPGYVQLTPGAARGWFNQVAPKTPLRGMVIDVSRTAAKNGRVNVKVQRYHSHESDALPADRDPILSLFKLWRVKTNPKHPNLSLVTAPDEVPEDGEIPGVS